MVALVFVIGTAFESGASNLMQGRAEVAHSIPLAFDANAESGRTVFDDDMVVVKAGKVITLAGEALKDVTIVIRNGKIEAIGENVDYPFGTKVIDATDLTVMPGMINPLSRLIRNGSGGGVTPNRTQASSFRGKPEDLESIAYAGYTTLGIVPPGSGIPGRVMVLKTGGTSREDLIVQNEGAVLVTFNSPGNDKSRILRAFKSAQGELDKIEKARKAFDAKKKKGSKKKPTPKPSPRPTPKPKPKPTPKPTPKPKPGPTPKPKPGPKPKPKGGASSGTFKAPKINPLYAPLVDLIQKKEGATAIVEFGMSPYMVWAPSTSASSSFLHWEEIPKTYDFRHAYRIRNSVVKRNSAFNVRPESDLHLVAEKLGKEKALIAIFPVTNHFPYTKDKFNLGLLLHSKGCRVVFLPEMETWSSYAAMRENIARMVRNGFPRDEILKTVTLHAAEMLGLEKRLGSIEVGKDANLLFLTGDPLDFNSTVAKVMVEGKIVKTKARLR